MHCLLPDKPGPPGLPEIVDFDENMVKLKWDPPIRDGGAEIAGYVLEMKPKDSDVSTAQNGPTAATTPAA